MKRSWFTERDQESVMGEGSDAAQYKAQVLAGISDVEFLDAMIRVKAALDAFGGKVFIGADRIRFDRDGKVVSHNEPGQYATTAYVFHFDHEPMKGVPEEPDLNYADARNLYRSQVLPPESGNGSEPAPEPEAVAADRKSVV